MCFYVLFKKFNWYFAYSIWTVLIFHEDERLIQKWPHDPITTLKQTNKKQKEKKTK